MKLELHKGENPGERVVAEIDEGHLVNLFLNVIPAIQQRLERLEGRQGLIVTLIVGFNGILLACTLAVVFDLLFG